MGERAERSPRYVLRAVGGEEGDRDRLGVGLGQEHRVEEIVPGEHHAEDRARDQAGRDGRERDRQEGAEVRAAVGQRRFLDARRRGAKIREHHPDDEGAIERGVEHDHCPPSAQEADVAHEKVERDQRRDRRHGADDEKEIGEPDRARACRSRERVSRRHADDERQDRRSDRNDKARLQQRP